MSQNEILERRWETFVRELNATATGGTLPVELQSLLLDLAALGQATRLQGVEVLLLHALRVQADILAATSIGPRHHAFADVLEVVVVGGVKLTGPLATARRLWKRPQSRGGRSYTLAELVPFAPQRRR